jgi:hypothetical protein
MLDSYLLPGLAADLPQQRYAIMLPELHYHMSTGLSAADAMRLARAVSQAGPLGKARNMLVLWLLEGMDAQKQARYAANTAFDV